jgi:hypothetical protein
MAHVRKHQWASFGMGFKYIRQSSLLNSSSRHKCVNCCVHHFSPHLVTNAPILTFLDKRRPCSTSRLFPHNGTHGDLMIATTSCPSCGHQNELMACQCGGMSFRYGRLVNGSTGMICDRCNMGFAARPCERCGKTFSASQFLSPGQRIASSIGDGIRAYNGGPCFIATELYGADSLQVTILRRFRDQVLLPHRVGVNLVAAYYRSSPEIISAMRRSVLLRQTVRVAVALAVWSARRISPLPITQYHQGLIVEQHEQLSSH